VEKADEDCSASDEEIERIFLQGAERLERETILYIFLFL
jgi:hypothetical protein